MFSFTGFLFCVHRVFILTYSVSKSICIHKSKFLQLSSDFYGKMRIVKFSEKMKGQLSYSLNYTKFILHSKRRRFVKCFTCLMFPLLIYFMNATAGQVESRTVLYKRNRFTFSSPRCSKSEARCEKNFFSYVEKMHPVH